MWVFEEMKERVANVLGAVAEELSPGSTKGRAGRSGGASTMGSANAIGAVVLDVSAVMIAAAISVGIVVMVVVSAQAKK